MGSLMAGWDSPVLENPETFRVERNRSLTREEIQSFWRLHKKPRDEEEEVDEGTDEPVMKKKQYSSSAPSAYKDSFLKNWAATRKQLVKSSSPKSPRSPKASAAFALGGGLPVQPANERDNKTGDWWMRSNWAFLNEPPQELNDGVAYKYRPQFDVARIASAGRAWAISSTDRHGLKRRIIEP